FAFNAGALINVNSGFTFQGIGPNHACGVQMPLTYAVNIGDPADLEYNPCFMVSGASNVLITGIWIKNCGGDGITATGGAQLSVTNNLISSNVRQGIAVTDGATIVITGNQFQNGNMTAVDYEPNRNSDGSPGVVNVTSTLRNNTSSGNKGGFVSFGFGNIKSPSKVAIDCGNNSSVNDGGDGVSFDKPQH